VQSTATTDVMRPPYPAEPGAGVYSNKLGMWVFLASDVMFFTALIGTYIVLRFGLTTPWAKPGAVLNVPLTGFNTFLLICSSVSMVKAYAAIADGKKYFLRKVPGKTLQDGGLKFWMLVTILCGAAFVGVQVFEYIKLLGHGFTPTGYREGSILAEHALADPVKYGAGLVAGEFGSSGIYGSSFFTMTGFHGFHVTCGVISMLYLYFTKVLPEKYSAQDYRGIEVIGLYWHFVDLVWIILFTIVYLI
jgi:heme/copper-type cytochrome/quinol oxidase subunit 3